MNQLQKFFLQNPGAQEIVYKILDLFHPDLLEKDRDRVKTGFKYDWVCLCSRKVYLCFEFEHGFFGGGYTIDDFKKAYHEGHFIIWRSVLDSKFNPIQGNLRNEITKEVFQVIMKDVPKPTPQEMLDYYYKD